jgi:hypothetical protein
MDARTHNAAVIAVSDLERAADIAGAAVDAMRAVGGIQAADVALEILAARTSLLAAQSKARRLLSKVPR